MANQFIPDQSEDFKKSGQKLITDPASDILLEQAREKENECELDYATFDK